MDHINPQDMGTEFDLERGLAVTEDNSKKDSSPGTAKQEKSLFTMVSGGFIGCSMTTEDKPSLYCNELNLSRVSLDAVDVTNKLLAVQDSDDMEKTLVKEKRKKASNKRALKPPRPPRAQSLDTADQKLIRELSELAMLKRARIERMKALKKTKASKSSSSSSSMLATIFTIVFFLVIIVQGMSSGKSSAASFQGSPLSTGAADSSLIPAQYPLNPSANNPNAPGLESHNNFVKQVTDLDLPEHMRSRPV